MGQRFDREARFVRRLRERFPMMAVANLSPLIDRLRLVKSEAELHCCGSPAVCRPWR